MNGSELNSRTQREMSRLKRIQLQVADKLRREYYRHDAASRGNFVWRTLFEYLLDDVADKDASMERRFVNSWSESEEYLSKLETYIENLKNFSITDEPSDEELTRRRDDIKKDIAELEKKIEEKRELLDLMSNNLQSLQKTKQGLSQVHETPEFILLSNWVRDTCDKCMVMENEITEMKLRISQKNEDVLEFLGFGQIFSEVPEGDSNEGPPFRTDEEQGASSSMSFQ